MKCENCGKEHDGSFGSGRFCSRSCANTRIHSNKTKEKIKNTLSDINKLGGTCNFCGRFIKSKRSLYIHQKHCKQNPNGVPYEYKKRKVVDVNDKFKFRDGTELDVTIDFINNYKNNIKNCEICGQSIEEVIHSTKKFAPKSLCVDHDHSTNKFRGLLCQRCNSFLGWYEKYQSNIENYLYKK